LAEIFILAENGKFVEKGRKMNQASVHCPSQAERLRNFLGVWPKRR
jgi:hypothetical protein